MLHNAGVQPNAHDVDTPHGLWPRLARKTVRQYVNLFGRGGNRFWRRLLCCQTLVARRT
jgi:hypothetical protein